MDGMWRIVGYEEEVVLSKKALVFMSDTEKFGLFMLRVVSEFDIACRENLTNPHTNHVAWIGQAACCLATNCPEYITRRVWGKLTEQQQEDANTLAMQAISQWEQDRDNEQSLGLI